MSSLQQPQAQRMIGITPILLATTLGFSLSHFWSMNRVLPCASNFSPSADFFFGQPVSGNDAHLNDTFFQRRTRLLKPCCAIPFHTLSLHWPDSERPRNPVPLLYMPGKMLPVCQFLSNEGCKSLACQLKIACCTN